MKYKSIICIVSLFIYLPVSAQDAIKVSANKKTTGWWPVTGKPARLEVYKNDLKNISTVIIDYKQQFVTPAYKRSIEVIGKDDKPIISVKESSVRKGRYNFNLTPVRKIILKQSVIRVFLIEEPADERMSLPSKRKLLGELHFKK